MRFIKQCVLALFAKFGFDIVHSSVVPRNSTPGLLANLKRAGFFPDLVLDVGVATGTPEIYACFPDAKFFLYEPLKEFEAYVQEIAQTYDADFFRCACGEKSGTVTFNVHADMFGSSLVKEHEDNNGKARTVDMIALDDHAERIAGYKRVFLKVDVQGAEAQVLRGAEKALRHIEAVLLETTLIDIFECGSTFADLVACMDRNGFCLYDVAGFNYRPIDGALAQVDALFVKKESLLRSDRRYAEPAQRKSQTAQFRKLLGLGE